MMQLKHASCIDATAATTVAAAAISVFVQHVDSGVCVQYNSTGNSVTAGLQMQSAITHHHHVQSAITASVQRRAFKAQAAQASSNENSDLPTST